jgi:hypothetical protein
MLLSLGRPGRLKLLLAPERTPELSERYLPCAPQASNNSGGSGSLTRWRRAERRSRPAAQRGVPAPAGRWEARDALGGDSRFVRPRTRHRLFTQRGDRERPRPAQSIMLGQSSPTEPVRE